MIYAFILTTLMTGYTIYAGDQATISKQQHHRKSGAASRRGKKRDQKPLPTLEQFARTKFPGPEAQSRKKMYKSGPDKRKRAKAWQEGILLEETMKAGSVEQLRAVGALLAARIDPNMYCLKECGISFQGSPLRNAALAGNKALTVLLLHAGADPGLSCCFPCKRGFGIEYPLHAAARARKRLSEFEGQYPEVIALLCTAGADVNYGGQSAELPFTPLHMTVLQRLNGHEVTPERVAQHIAVLDELLKYGGDTFKKTAHGETAIELAAKRGNSVLAERLWTKDVSQEVGIISHRVSADDRPIVKGELRRSREKIKSKDRELERQVKSDAREASSSYC